MHLIGTLYNFIIDWLIVLLYGLSRILAALIAIPFVFFMPKGKNMTYGQTVTKRLGFIGKTIVTAFNSK